MDFERSQKVIVHLQVGALGLKGCWRDVAMVAMAASAHVYVNSILSRICYFQNKVLAAACLLEHFSEPDSLVSFFENVAIGRGYRRFAG